MPQAKLEHGKSWFKTINEAFLKDWDADREESSHATNSGRFLDASPNKSVGGFFMRVFGHFRAKRVDNLGRCTGKLP